MRLTDNGKLQGALVPSTPRTRTAGASRLTYYSLASLVEHVFLLGVPSWSIHSVGRSEAENE
jgi:hypothetical protein